VLKRFEGICELHASSAFIVKKYLPVLKNICRC